MGSRGDSVELMRLDYLLRLSHHHKLGKKSLRFNTPLVSLPMSSKCTGIVSVASGGEEQAPSRATHFQVSSYPQLLSVTRKLLCFWLFWQLIPTAEFPFLGQVNKFPLQQILQLFTANGKVGLEVGRQQDQPEMVVFQLRDLWLPVGAHLGCDVERVYDPSREIPDVPLGQVQAGADAFAAPVRPVISVAHIACVG